MVILNFVLKNWKYILILALSILVYIYSVKFYKAEEIAKIQTANVEVLNSNYVSYKVAYNTGLKKIDGKDSIINLNTGKIGALVYTVEKYKKYAKKDAELISNMKIKLSKVQSVSNVGTTTITNTTMVLKDSCFNKATVWQDISGCILNNNINIRTTNRDKLVAVISVTNKHNFLWFHWGEKIEGLDVVSKNPNTIIDSIKYTIIKK